MRIEDRGRKIEDRGSRIALRAVRRFSILAFFVFSWLIFGGGAQLSTALAAQGKQVSYGPVVRAFLTGLDEELNELEYQLQRDEISRQNYERAKRRLTILRQFVERYAAENRGDIVPEYQALAEDELATLGLGREYKTEELVAGAELDDQWKIVWVQTEGIQSGVDNKSVRFLVIERLPQAQMGVMRESKLGRSIDPRDVIETIIIPATTAPIPHSQSPHAVQAEADTTGEARKPSLQWPRLLNVFLPRYSEKAIDKKIEGEVIVSALFRQNGKIQNARVEKGLGFGLDERAVEAVKRSTFLPAQLDGKDVVARAQIVIGFNLKRVYIYIAVAEPGDAGDEDKR